MPAGFFPIFLPKQTETKRSIFNHLSFRPFPHPPEQFSSFESLFFFGLDGYSDPMKQNRRFWWRSLCSGWACVLMMMMVVGWNGTVSTRAGQATLPKVRTHRIPVIFDTDIGDDIDDTWALGFLLQSPEYEVRLIVGDNGKNLYRAKLLAKLLERMGRTDIPIGIGLDRKAHGVGPQAEWVADYNLNRYPGKIYPDGVQALIETILHSTEPVTIVATGPVPNLAEALRREPRIAQKARFVGMHGSLRRGYGGRSKPDPEYNVRVDPQAFRAVVEAPWSVTITPLDTCGLVVLDGDLYARVRDSKHPVARVIMENYEIWSRHVSGMRERFPTRSSVLFDTVAIWLGMSEEYLKIETVPVKVTDDGYTRIDPAGRQIRAATEWKDLEAFKRELVDRITGGR